LTFDIKSFLTVILIFAFLIFNFIIMPFKKLSLKLSVILLTVAIIATFLHKIPLLSPIKNLVVIIISPVQKGFYNVGVSIGEKITPFFIKKDLIQENEILQERLAELYKENTELKLREKDYQILKTQLEFLEEHEWMECKTKSRLEGGTESCYILAQVIAKTPKPSSQTLIINKGTKDGLREDLPVIIDKGILIGKLSKVNKNTSQILLLLDHQSRVAALVQTSSERPKSEWSVRRSEAKSDLIMGIVKGQHDLSLIMDLIPLDKKITSGDPVITSGLEPDIPAGLLIGYIDNTETSSNRLFQKAIVRPLTDFEGLRIVIILIPEPVKGLQ
jgi:rod shape-determining protein MreC